MDSSSKYFAVLVAGGLGNRMQSAVAKQFLLLEGRPVLMHTIAAFSRCPIDIQIVVVLNRLQHDHWKELCNIHHFSVPHTVVAGGEQRFHSVKNGLKAIDGAGIVAIHDAVRPLISPRLIMSSYKEAEQKGNCIVAIKATDSIRKWSSDGQSVALNRNDVVMVQTPQTFRVDLIKQCYDAPYAGHFTDDASVAECAGIPIHIIEGERENIKITFPEDLEIARIFLKKRGL